MHRPMLRPTEEFFPDAWRPDLDGASALLQRLLHWVRLDDRRFVITPYENEVELVGRKLPSRLLPAATAPPQLTLSV